MFENSKLIKNIGKRLGYYSIADFARKKEIPHHRYSFLYYLGGAILFLVGIQIITGIVLLFYYQASAETAHESVAMIMTAVPFGWIIRSIHHWGSNIMIFLVLIHFFTTLLMKAYRPPGEITWMTGFGLLFCSVTLGYTGYVLPWDERSYFAVKVGSQMPEGLPLIGEHLKHFLRGGDQITGATLNRFFAMHVGLMPWILLMFIGIHIALVQLLGMSIPMGIQGKKEKIETRPFFPYELFRDFSNWAILFGILLTLAIFFVPGLEPGADPLKPAPEGIKPDWFFLSIYQFLKLLPTTILGIPGEIAGITLIFSAVIFLVLIPFIDVRSKNNRKSPLFTAAGIAVVIYFMVMTIWGAL